MCIVSSHHLQGPGSLVIHSVAEKTEALRVKIRFDTTLPVAVPGENVTKATVHPLIYLLLMEMQGVSTAGRQSSLRVHEFSSLFLNVDFSHYKQQNSQGNSLHVNKTVSH